jgi:hypothetical protein
MARPIVWSLALALISGACQRTQVDPAAMASDIGKFAFAFYRALNDEEFEPAGQFLSPRLRALYPDPNSAPIIAERRELRYHRVMAETGADAIDVDWRRNVGIVRVRFYEIVPSEPVDTNRLREIRSERHRWIKIEDVWVFDGSVD